MKRFILLLLVLSMFAIVGCNMESQTVTRGAADDTKNTLKLADDMQANQATPTDIDYSLERYNLIRRAYWVNAQRERANALVCPVEKPLGYVVLLTQGGSIFGKFTVDGKVSSLNSYLTPDSEYFELLVGGGDSRYTEKNRWLPDTDGTYGYNDDGIFFFDIQGRYIEWTGDYLYSDIPMHVDNPLIRFDMGEK